MLIVSKGNGKNFYGYLGDQILEIVKVSWRFYRYEWSDKVWAYIPKGEPITNYRLG